MFKTFIKTFETEQEAKAYAIPRGYIWGYHAYSVGGVWYVDYRECE